MALICIRVHSPLFFCHFSTTIFHMKCSVADHFVTSQVFSHEISRSESLCHSQLRPFHVECPDPGHSTKNCVQDSIQICQLIIYCLGHIVDLVVLLIYYSDCVDRSGSLSGGAFDQLRLATINIVLTILY